MWMKARSWRKARAGRQEVALQPPLRTCAREHLHDPHPVRRGSSLSRISRWRPIGHSKTGVETIGARLVRHQPEARPVPPDYVGRNRPRTRVDRPRCLRDVRSRLRSRGNPGGPGPQQRRVGVRVIPIGDRPRDEGGRALPEPAGLVEELFRTILLIHSRGCGGARDPVRVRDRDLCERKEPSTGCRRRLRPVPPRRTEKIIGQRGRSGAVRPSVT